MFFDQLIEFVMAYLYWVIGGGVLLICAVLFTVFFLRSRSHKKILQKAVDDPVFYKEHREQVEKLARSHQKLVLSLSTQLDRNLAEYFDLYESWLHAFEKSPKTATIKPLLTYFPDKALFTCFRKALKKGGLKKIMFKWIDESEDMLALRRLAMSGKGEEFDSQLAFQLFSERIADIREMSGDPEWPTRYFAIKLIIKDSAEERSKRIVNDAFSDPHPLVRRTLVQEVPAESVEGDLKDMLLEMIKSDPVKEVRDAAWRRLNKDHKSDIILDFSETTHGEAIHLADYLRADSQEDKAVAFELLDNDNREIRYKAARFLESIEALKELCESANSAEHDGFENIRQILEKCCEVDICGFLNTVKTSRKADSIMLLSKLLQKYGGNELLSELAKHIFLLIDQRDDAASAYEHILDAIVERGDEESIKLLAAEIEKRQQTPELLKLLLEHIPGLGHYITYPVLWKLFLQGDCPLKAELRKALRSFETHRFVNPAAEIIRADRSEYDHTVRMEAMKLLLEAGETSVIKLVMENLRILPPDQAKEFVGELQALAGDLFHEYAEQLLNSVDSQVRAALISAIPASGRKSYISDIKKGFKDADPDVRIASVWAVVDFEDSKTLATAYDLLRDPVERVRVSVAHAVGGFGSEAGLKQLESVLQDENEVASVKQAVISGLSCSSDSQAVGILCEKLARNDELQDEVTAALADMREPKFLHRMIEFFKDGDPVFRDHITSVFKIISIEAEEPLKSLLQEDIPSLHSFLVEILDSTGFVETNIRRLMHRDPEIRIEAAKVLSLIASLSAFRGIVLAARDPHEEVRVQVVKALEHLNTKEGKDILEELRKDPDKRVRNYTEWALERLESKNS